MRCLGEQWRFLPGHYDGKQRATVRSERDKYTLQHSNKKEIKEDGEGCRCVKILVYTLKIGQCWAHLLPDKKSMESLQIWGWERLDQEAAEVMEDTKCPAPLPWEQRLPNTLWNPDTLLLVLKPYNSNKHAISLNSHPNFQRWDRNTQEQNFRNFRFLTKSTNHVWSSNLYFVWL